MDGQVTTSQLAELIQDGADVLTTLLDFGEAQIKRSSKKELSLLTISGIYSTKLAKEIEKIAMQCRGNIGIEFKDMQVNPKLGRKFDSSIVGLLRTIRDRYRKRNRLLVLTAPPTELVDLLKLTGVYEGYHIVERGTNRVIPSSVSHGRAARPKKDSMVSSEKEAIRKKIVHLNQSLERTVSLEKGLDSAEQCVLRFLPQAPPQVPDYSFSFSYKSSEKVGGDFFDFFMLDDEHLGLSIGDVSGHGIDAALLMGISKKVTRIRALDAGAKASPKSVLCVANVDLFSDFKRSAFVTVLYGIVHLPTGRFTYARAGHEPPVCFGPERGRAELHDSKGLPLGVDSGKLFDRVLDVKTIEIPPGGFMLVCTDGLAECWNYRGATYSRERLLFTLEQFDYRLSCQDALDGLLKSVSDFSQGRPQEDDMTTIMMKRL